MVEDWGIVQSPPVARPPILDLHHPATRPIFSGQAVFIPTDHLCNNPNGLRGADLLRHLLPSEFESDPRDATLFVSPPRSTLLFACQLNQPPSRLVPLQLQIQFPSTFYQRPTSSPADKLPPTQNTRRTDTSPYVSATPLPAVDAGSKGGEIHPRARPYSCCDSHIWLQSLPIFGLGLLWKRQSCCAARYVPRIYRSATVAASVIPPLAVSTRAAANVAFALIIYHRLPLGFNFDHLAGFRLLSMYL